MNKIILLIILIISFQGCATWMGIKKDTNDAWNVTKDTSKDVYKSVKKSINEATSE
ncbi:entericidin EcnAB [Arcobacter sp. s6]|uniref:entericidin EcnAB n=1 Tax=Arcobacter sp. s6 TaxID=3230363 RepID=UPI0034A09094